MKLNFLLIPLLLNCSPPQHFYSQKAPKEKSITQIDMDNTEEDRLIPIKLDGKDVFFDKKLGIYCEKTYKCLPLTTVSRKVTNDCSYEQKNILFSTEDIKDKIGYTRIENKFYTVTVTTEQIDLYEGNYFTPSNPTAFCKKLGNYKIFLVWPEREVSIDLFD